MKMPWTIAALVMAGCAPSTLGAQTGSGDSLTCSQAARVAKGETTEIPRGVGVWRLRGCVQEFGEVLPVLWRDPAVPDNVFDKVKEASLLVNDRRVFAGAMDAAKDGALPVERRLAAMEVLAHYVDPSAAVTSEMLANPPGNPVLRTSTHSALRPGGQPVSTDAATHALETFAAVSTGGGPIEVQRAAKYLRQAFAWQVPEATPIQPGAVIATWDCRGHFRMENRGDIDLPVTVLDSAGKRLQTFDLLAPASPGAKPVVMTYDRTGPLALRLGSRTLQTLSCQ